MGVPRHIALIPDGNRRWAKEKGVKPWEGHEVGIKLFREFLNWCEETGVEEVTAYSLSKENQEKRPAEEIEFLFKLYKENLLDLIESNEVLEKGIRIRFAGDLEVFPESIQELIAKVEEKTKNFDSLKVNLCVNYSGRDEILQAAKKTVEQGETLTEKNLEKHLEVGSAPDLLIRTAENRISNFLLWQCAYSEIYFSPKMFPEFSKEDFQEALEQFDKTERRYGK